MNQQELSTTKLALEQLAISSSFPEKVLTASAYLHFLKNKQIVISTEPYDALYIILEGKAFVTSYSVHGDKVIIDTLEQGEFFGDIELYSHKHLSLHHVVAASDTAVLKIPSAVVEDILNQHIPFLNLMCQRLTEKLMNTSFNYSKALLQPAKNKLARYIIEQYELTESLEIPFSVKRIAEILGISDRHLRRIIHDFEAQQLLVKHHSSMSLLSLDKLVRLANE